MTDKTVQALALDYVSERRRRGQFNGRTPRTVASILLGLASFVGPDLPASRLTRGHLERWATSLDKRPTTVRQQISAVRAFCAWLAANDHLKADPSRSLRGPRPTRSVPRGLRAEAVTKVYTSLPDSRAELVVSLMVQEGLRCCEVAGLELGDVDFNDGSLFVRGKGGHERVVPMTDETRRAMTHYLAEYPARTGPLVRSYRSPLAPMTAGHISRMVGGWMAAAGIKQAKWDGVAAHSLRHTAATDMLRSGAHLRDVQTVLGHASLATTQRYLPWVVNDLRQAMGSRTYRPDPGAA